MISGGSMDHVRPSSMSRSYINIIFNTTMAIRQVPRLTFKSKWVGETD